MTEIVGIIKNYRLGSRTQKPNQCVIYIEEYDKKKSSALIGKRVVLNLGSTSIFGKITNLHGNKGALVARFNKGIPGQAIGKQVIIQA